MQFARHCGVRTVQQWFHRCDTNSHTISPRLYINDIHSWYPIKSNHDIHTSNHVYIYATSSGLRPNQSVQIPDH